MKVKLIESTLENDTTLEQEEYFKDSKMRKPNSDLIVFYNSGERKDRIIYNCDNYPYFFSKSEVYSKEYGDTTYKVYLNITNPFSKVNRYEYNLIFNDFIQYCDDNDITPLGIEEVKIGSYIPFELVDTLYDYLRDYSSYDGIICKEYGDNTSYYTSFGSDGQTSYVPFYSNQIKLIDNKNPTTSNLIDR